MAEILHQLRCSVSIIHNFLYHPRRLAGFLPSTVSYSLSLSLFDALSFFFFEGWLKLKLGGRKLVEESEYDNKKHGNMPRRVVTQYLPRSLTAKAPEKWVLGKQAFPIESRSLFFQGRAVKVGVLDMQMILRGSGYLGYVDSNQVFFLPLFSWVLCPQILGL